jgi:transcription initiation factor TFIIIB Brf1 subunit/transcription initiation factor TFIIB
MIKICVNPHCDEIAHRINKKETRCRNCGMIMVEISVDTYREKFINYPHQVDYSTGERVTPVQMGYSLQLIIPF